MNPDPPPIADPHSTAPVLSATEPNIWTATIAPIVLWLLGVPLVLLGIFYVVLTPLAAGDYGFSPVFVVKSVVFGLVLIFLGSVLIYFGSRLWKRSRTPPS